MNNMVGEEKPVFLIKQVGTVRGGPGEPVLALSDGELHMSDGGVSRSATADQESEIVVYDEYAGCLDGIEDFSHIVVLYWSHLVGEEGRMVKKVHPAGQKDLAKVGVFSTRSPARPNPICATTVKLLRREENVLKVSGLDAVDGSPVIDLKPHLPSFDAPKNVKLAGWMNELMRRFGRND